MPRFKVFLIFNGTVCWDKSVKEDLYFESQDADICDCLKLLVPPEYCL
jgi:hypothetical protein